VSTLQRYVRARSRMLPSASPPISRLGLRRFQAWYLEHDKRCAIAPANIIRSELINYDVINGSRGCRGGAPEKHLRVFH